MGMLNAQIFLKRISKATIDFNNRIIWSKERRGEERRGGELHVNRPWKEASLERSPDWVEGQNSQLLSQSWKSLSNPLYSRHIRSPSHEHTYTRLLFEMHADMQRLWRKFLLVFLFSSIEYAESNKQRKEEVSGTEIRTFHVTDSPIDRVRISTTWPPIRFVLKFSRGRKIESDRCVSRSEDFVETVDASRGESVQRWI